MCCDSSEHPKKSRVKGARRALEKNTKPVGTSDNLQGNVLDLYEVGGDPHHNVSNPLSRPFGQQLVQLVVCNNG